MQNINSITSASVVQIQKSLQHRGGQRGLKSLAESKMLKQPNKTGATPSILKKYSCSSEHRGKKKNKTDFRVKGAGTN